jgi:hypothetical protein
MGAQVPVLVLSVFIVYQIRKSADGIANRCIKMALTGIFLSYTFVSQVHATSDAPRTSCT